MTQAQRRNSGYHAWHKIFVKFALSHALFLSLRGKPKEQESGGQKVYGEFSYQGRTSQYVKLRRRV